MDSSDIDEMFSSLGAVTVRRMFGGKGIYHRGLILAIEVEGEMLLKADAASAPFFAAAGARRWTYEGRGGKAVEMPYWSVPDRGLRRPRRDGALGAAGLGGGDAGRDGRRALQKAKGRHRGRPRSSETKSADAAFQPITNIPVVAPQF